MKRCLVLSIVVFVLISGLLSTLVPGCSQPAPSPAPSPAPASKATPVQTPTPAPTTKPSAATSKPAGTLVEATNDFGDEVWLVNQSNTTLTLVSSCYDYLLYRDQQGNYIAGLAEKWDVSPDGKTYTFRLRKGIQFHDGWGELTADDVKYSYELGISKGTRSNALPIWAKAMDKVEVTDPYTIVFRLKNFDLSLLSKVPREYNPQFPIVSKKYIDKVGVEQAGRKPIGTGPYKFVEHEFGVYIKFEAVENHWRKTPAFKTLIIKKVPEEASRIAMLRAGEADIVDLSLAAKADVVKAGFKLKTVPNAVGYYIALGGQWLPTVPTFDAKYPWVGDPRDPASWDRALKVRKALNLAVNRDEIVKTMLGGEAQPQAVIRFFPGSEGYDPALKPYPFDPEGAKKLLAEAGYPGGFDMTMKLFAMTGRAEGVKIGEAVAMMWQKIGVKAKLEPTEWVAFKPAVQTRKTPGMAWAYGFLFDELPVVGYFQSAHSKTVAPSTNTFGFETAELDKFIDQANAEPNDKLRTKIEQQMGQYIYDNYLGVPVAITTTIYGLSNRIGDWSPTVGAPGNLESITYGPGFKP